MKEFLGLEYEIEVLPTAKDFTIDIGSKKLVIRNHFFKNDDLPTLYQKQNLPSEVTSDEVIIEEKNIRVIVFLENQYGLKLKMK